MKLQKTITTKNTTETYEIENTILKVVKNYVNGKLMSVSLNGKGPHGSFPVVVKPSFNEAIKNKNPFHLHLKEHIYDQSEYIEIDFDKAIKEKLIYYFYTSGHVLFDFKENPVPLPMTFDYIGTDFHSNATDIEKVKDVLSVHPWVLNKDALKIENVPYYNADGYNHRFLTVTLLPDDKAYKKMYNMAIESKKSFSVELKELIIGSSFFYPKHNPLKIHKFRIKK